MFRFPWGDMHSLNLGWFLQKFNELREDWATAEAGIDGALDAEIQRAEDALSDVFDARDAAAASATAAAGSASAAGTQATLAQNSATAAASSATLANNKANAAGLSEAAAAQSATQAGNSATAAATSATQAGQSATNAAGSATTAGQQATNAAGSATAASNSATAAAGSATAAAASAAAAEAVEESIPTDYTTLSSLANALGNNFPSVLTPMKKAQSGSYNGLSRAEGIYNFLPTSGGATGIALFDPVQLQPGTYKIVINLIKNTVESSTNVRYGYIAVVSGSVYAPIIDMLPNGLLTPQKIERTFNVATAANYSIVAAILGTDATGGEAIAQAYIEIAQPAALGMSSGIRDSITDTLAEEVRQ